MKLRHWTAALLVLMSTGSAFAQRQKVTEPHELPIGIPMPSNISYYYVIDEEATPCVTD